MDQAWQRYERYDALLDHVFKVAARGKKNIFAAEVPQAQMESTMLRAIILFELNKNKTDPTWTFLNKGLVRVNDDFFLLQEYVMSAYSDQFGQLCERWGNFVLTPAEIAELDQLTEEEHRDTKLTKLRPHFQPAWSFLVALCHALQEGENELSALDAFWLGLIDEVLGHPNLPLTRYFAEYRPGPAQTEAPPDSSAADSQEPPPPANG